MIHLFYGSFLFSFLFPWLKKLIFLSLFVIIPRYQLLLLTLTFSFLLLLHSRSALFGQHGSWDCFSGRKGNATAHTVIAVHDIAVKNCTKICTCTTIHLFFCFQFFYS